MASCSAPTGPSRSSRAIDRAGSFEYVDAAGHGQFEELIPPHAIVQGKQKPGKQDVIVSLVRSLLAKNPDERVIVFRDKKGSACARLRELPR